MLLPSSVFFELATPLLGQPKKKFYSLPCTRKGGGCSWNFWFCLILFLFILWYVLLQLNPDRFWACEGCPHLRIYRGARMLVGCLIMWSLTLRSSIPHSQKWRSPLPFKYPCPLPAARTLPLPEGQNGGRSHPWHSKLMQPGQESLTWSWTRIFSWICKKIALGHGWI